MVLTCRTEVCAHVVFEVRARAVFEVRARVVFEVCARVACVEFEVRAREKLALTPPEFTVLHRLGIVFHL